MAITSPLRSKSLHHVAYATRDPEATHAFYSGKLGMPLVHTENHRQGDGYFRHFFYDMGGGDFLGFFQVEDVGEKEDYQTAVSVAAGLPIEAVQDNETLAVPPDMVRRRKDNYVLRVEGNSMIEEQIRDGDYIVVQAQESAEDGQMVVALVSGEAATVKKLYREPGGRIRLQPANPTMEPIVVDATDVRVQGVVVGVIRKY